MSRTLVLVYALGASVVAGVVLAYTLGFLVGVGVPKHVDSGPVSPMLEALLVDFGLLGLFGFQHSLMARDAFKRLWTRIVPAPAERATYVLLSAVVLAVVLWGWRPLPEVIYELDGAPAWALVGLFLAACAFELWAAGAVDGLEVLGIRQALAHYRNEPFRPPAFVAHGIYRWVRHPLMTGVVLILWITPRLTVGHAVFAAGLSVYVVIGTLLEERDLGGRFGDRYRAYAAGTPMFVPRPPPRP